MKLTRECEECKTTFEFTKDKIKNKKLKEKEYEPLPHRSYETKREGGFFGEDVTYLTTIDSFNLFWITYKTIKCPICNRINYLTKIKEEFISHGTEESTTSKGDY